MRIRTKVVLGTSFALGYYFGTKAGRERYEQLRRALDAVPLGKAVEKAQALVELAVARVSSLRGNRADVVTESDAVVLPASSIRSA
jgi:hypothetical protein